MRDDFEVKPVFGDSQYEQSQFSLTIDGRKYQGYYQDGEIRWMQPHPKQDMSESKVKAVESEVFGLLRERGIREETEDIEVEPMVHNNTTPMQKFKLKTQGEEFSGTFLDGNIEWFQPKPESKMDDKRVKDLEEKVQKKMKNQSP